MPTAAKLVAAIVFALVGWLAANAYVPLLPEGAQIGMFREITALIGLAVGWMVMGPLAGRGYTTSMGIGVRTSITVVFWALLGFAIYEMVYRSTKGRYDGPMEAVTATFGIMIDHAREMGDVPFLGVLFFGGLIGGWLTEFAARRWR